MPIILLILIPLCAIIAYCCCKHFSSTKEFNPRLFDDMELFESEMRNTKPIIEPTPIPKAHIRSYYRDWFIFITIVVILGILLCGCSSSLKSGRKYVIEEVKGSGYVVKFYGMDELFTVPVNTHKPGDTVLVKRTYNETKATIY